MEGPTLVVIIALWLLFSFLIGAWSISKGKGFGLGFCISFFISPIFGAIIVALLSESKDSILKGAIENGELKKCPSCAEYIKQEAIKCRFCNSDL
jgi:hypothetical protein